MQSLVTCLRARCGAHLSLLFVIGAVTAPAAGCNPTTASGADAGDTATEDAPE